MNGFDLFESLKHYSIEFTIPFNSNMFFIPKTKSIFSCISETKYLKSMTMKLSNITGTINNTLTYCPFFT